MESLNVIRKTEESSALVTLEKRGSDIDFAE